MNANVHKILNVGHTTDNCVPCMVAHGGGGIIIKTGCPEPTFGRAGL